MSHGFSIACLFVCLFAGHIFWWLMIHLSKTHKEKGETFVMANAQLIFPSKVMVETVNKTVYYSPVNRNKTISQEKPK